MNYHYVYDDEFKAAPTTKINAMKTTLTNVWIGFDCARDCRWAYNLGCAIQTFRIYGIGADFQAVGFRRLAEIITDDGLQKCYGWIRNAGENE